MSELAADEQWQRLDPRMLLVHPIRELVRFLPVLVGVFVAGTASGGDGPWRLVGVAVPVGLGLLRYLTTSFRISRGRVELRRGLLNRHVLTTRVDRVRTVDLTASPVHRLLGLTTVRIGTGTTAGDEEDGLDLDGLPTARARRLRAELLHASSVPDAEEQAAEPRPEVTDLVVLRLDPAWARFAPLTGGGLVIGLGVLGAGSQLLDAVGTWDRLDPRRLLDEATGLSPWISVPVSLLGLALAASALAIGGYLVGNGGFTLTRSPQHGTWHLRRGLVTTRETSLDDDRVAGVVSSSPLGLRLAGGATLHAIVTGLDREQRSSATLVPPAPAGVVARIAAEVLGTPAPLTVPLTGHGPRARARRFTRALVPTSLLLVALGGLVVAGLDPRWLLLAPPALLAALALAADRSRGLGHALTASYVVAGAGSLNRRREVLASEHVIGWTLRSSWFQRRAGLTSLVATTAGGRQSVTVLDVPEADAVALADAAVPGLVAQFTR